MAANKWLNIITKINFLHTIKIINYENNGIAQTSGCLAVKFFNKNCKRVKNKKITKYPKVSAIRKQMIACMTIANLKTSWWLEIWQPDVQFYGQGSAATVGRTVLGLGSRQITPQLVL